MCLIPLKIHENLTEDRRPKPSLSRSTKGVGETDEIFRHISPCRTQEIRWFGSEMVIVLCE